MTTANIDTSETDLFGGLAGQWWDPHGPMRVLHRINPIRLGLIRRACDSAWGLDSSSIRPFAGRTALDIGCGAGLVCEPLARLGAAVTGIDAAAPAIATASTHAAAAGLSIDYRETTVEALAASGARYDLVTALEVVEHVPDQIAFLKAAAQLVAPGGVIVVSTLNRTLKGLVLGIGVAEYVVRWVPRGGHDWRRFLRPHQVAAPLRAAGIQVTDSQGLAFDPLRNRFFLTRRDLSVNYFLIGTRTD